MKKESTIFMMNGKIVNCQRRIKKVVEINQDIFIKKFENFKAKVHITNQNGLSILQNFLNYQL